MFISVTVHSFNRLILSLQTLFLLRFILVFHLFYILQYLELDLHLLKRAIVLKTQQLWRLPTHPPPPPLLRFITLALFKKYILNNNKNILTCIVMLYTICLFFYRYFTK